MISIVQPLPIGNALRLFLEPPATALRWKVLRKGSNAIAAHDDPTAALIYDGNERVFIDSSFLQNTVMVFYRAFYTSDDLVWTASDVASGTPAAIYTENTTDVMTVVRDRLEAGLKVELERGNLTNEMGYIPVYTASPSLERDLSFPLVTVHLDAEDPTIRGVGELIGEEDADEDSEGWIADVRLIIVAWSLNGDERSEMRKAIRRVVLGNLPVFADKGFMQVQLSQQDVDAVNGEFAAPIYQVMSTFSCLAPVAVAGTVPIVRDVIARSI